MAFDNIMEMGLMVAGAFILAFMVLSIGSAMPTPQYEVTTQADWEEGTLGDGLTAEDGTLHFIPSEDGEYGLADSGSSASPSDGAQVRYETNVDETGVEVRFYSDADGNELLGSTTLDDDETAWVSIPESVINETVERVEVIGTTEQSSLSIDEDGDGTAEQQFTSMSEQIGTDVTSATYTSPEQEFSENLTELRAYTDVDENASVTATVTAYSNGSAVETVTQELDNQRVDLANISEADADTYDVELQFERDSTEYNAQVESYEVQQTGTQSIIGWIAGLLLLVTSIGYAVTQR